MFVLLQNLQESTRLGTTHEERVSVTRKVRLRPMPTPIQKNVRLETPFFPKTFRNVSHEEGREEKREEEDERR